MNAEEFERGYRERNGLSLKDYRRFKVTLPCTCDFIECNGWAAVSRTSVAHQIEFCMDDEQLEQAMLDNDIQALLLYERQEIDSVLAGAE